MVFSHKQINKPTLGGGVGNMALSRVEKNKINR